MYKIISKRSSYLERSITFSVDGKIDTISAPAANASFDDLILCIEQKYGEQKEEKPVDVETGDKSTKRGRKSSSKADKAED